jgi:hypothetical protein
MGLFDNFKTAKEKELSKDVSSWATPNVHRETVLEPQKNVNDKDNEFPQFPVKKSCKSDIADEIKTSRVEYDIDEPPIPVREEDVPKKKNNSGGLIIVVLILAVGAYFAITNGWFGNHQPYQVEGTVYSVVYEKSHTEASAIIPDKYYVEISFVDKNGNAKVLKWDTTFEEYAKYQVGSKINVTVK